MNIFMLILGVLIINITHLISAIGGLRQSLITKYSRRKFFAAYGLTSTAALLLIISGFYQRDFTPIYQPPIWGTNFNKATMLLAFFMLSSQFFNGHIKRWVKAPAITSIVIWSFGHLCANGDLHSIIMFGGFLLYALTALYFKHQKPTPNTTYHYKYDIYAFTIGFIIYSAVGMAHPYFTGVSVF
ncbi:MAG: hypothetical protein COC24_012845 [Alphaproteobacteria bacterium]|nr:hypothetical protein [Alphaproteobacteria bacterium]